LNAYNEAHRKLAAEQGLFISVPFSEDKRKQLIETLEKIKEELQILNESRFLELQGRIEKIKERLGIIKELKALEKQIDEKAKARARYAPEDPVEGWLYEALLLSAEPAELGGEQVSLEEGVYAEPDLNAWFEGDEEHLRQFVGIYVLAHYRNRPDDLLILGDAPHHSARAVFSRSNKVLVALQINEEGVMSEELVEQVLKGKPPSGHLVPSCIVK
jgi:hypothetical protein